MTTTTTPTPTPTKQHRRSRRALKREGYYSATEAAARIGVSRPALGFAMRTGKLTPDINEGGYIYFTIEAIEAYIKKYYY